MDSKIISAISSKIYRQFPEMKGIKPKVKPQLSAKYAIPIFTLSFQSKVITNNGVSLSRWVRVVVDEQGKIRKITTSH
jgi:hypothetical protein